MARFPVLLVLLCCSRIWKTLDFRHESAMLVIWCRLGAATPSEWIFYFSMRISRCIVLGGLGNRSAYATVIEHPKHVLRDAQVPEVGSGHSAGNCMALHGCLGCMDRDSRFPAQCRRVGV